MEKIFTYVSPRTNHSVAMDLISQLPITLRPLDAVEELFPLMSDPNYHTDFIAISIEMFAARPDLDMFDIVHTLATLIKSTVFRPTLGEKPQRRSTKIFVLVDETTEPEMVKKVMHFPDIATVSWLLKDPTDLPSIIDHAKRIIDGDYTPHPKVLEHVKPKKKTSEKKEIKLTTRQAQILDIIKSRGASNKNIAKMLNISESTVKLHVSAILRKYNLRNRTQLVLFSQNN